MNRNILLKTAELLQSMALSFITDKISEEDFKSNLKILNGTINTDIMDMQIGFYNKAEGCSHANRFQGYMTLAHLIEGISLNTFKVVTGSDFSEAFGQDVEMNVLDINGNKAAGVVLQNGTQVIFNAKDPSYVWYRISGPQPEWAEQLNEICIKKEDAGPKFKPIP